MPLVNAAIRAYLLDLEERQCSIEHIRSVRSRLGAFAVEYGRKNLYLINRAVLARYFRALNDGNRSPMGHQELIFTKEILW